jgi:pantoate--beta-alanine ligase
MMRIVSDIHEWQKIRNSLKGTVGFVPTMGNLHAGHAALCEQAKAENDVTVVSIFVNPTQFNQTADFDAYQRTLEADCALLETLGIDYVFCPTAKDLYPDEYEVQISETAVSLTLEGEFRKGHFTGMLTVVLKLLNLVAPTTAYFGEKDFQQLLLVKKMAAALFLPVVIIACPTVREASGLALSSRNNRLSAAARAKAAFIYQAISSSDDDATVMEKLKHNGFEPEYVATQWGRRLVAVWLDGVRLIDNVVREKI